MNHITPQRSTPEQELAVEVRDVDSVQIDHIDVAKARQSKVFQQLATQATGSDA